MNKIQIIVNNGAGTGSAVHVWKETKEYLLEKNIVYTAYLTRYEKHAARLARQICERHKEGRSICWS
ncbi:MAG: diacylglycerol kinase family protein [Oliverpabstia sp.]